MSWLTWELAAVLVAVIAGSVVLTWRWWDVRDRAAQRGKVVVDHEAAILRLSQALEEMSKRTAQLERDSNNAKMGGALGARRAG